MAVNRSSEPASESHMLEDRLLIWQVKRGSKDAFSRIYTKYEDDLLTLAVNLLNDVSAAEDTVHDVFASFAKSVDSFHLTGSLRSYLATCVANLARDRIRKGKREKGVDLNRAAQTASEVSGPVESVLHSEQLQQLAEVMAQLPYEQREVIMLRLHGGMTFKQIGKSQNASINTIKSRYRYGLDKIRMLLNAEIENETRK